MKTTKCQLKNKLKVLLVENHTSPVVSIQIWVKNGSADETRGFEGVSHFIEHLVFKGSGRYGVGEIASTIEGSGGVLNAYTTFDQTVFYTTLSKASADIGLEVMSDLVGRPVFDKVEVDKEREVVIEEIRRGRDSSSQQAAQVLFESCFKGHTYATPIIGFEKIIAKIPQQKIVDYYKGHYGSDRMLLVVAGDFKTAEMKKKVESQFGDLEICKRKKGPSKRGKFPMKTGLANTHVSKFKETHLYLTWKIPKLIHKDNIELSIISQILGAGESSLLVNRLRNELGLVRSIGAGPLSLVDGGLFVVSATMDAKNVQTTLAEIENVLGNFLKVGPTHEQMERAIRNTQSDKYYSMETVDSLSSQVGYAEYFYGDHHVLEKQLKYLESLNVSRLLKIAQKYLKKANCQPILSWNPDKSVPAVNLKSWQKKKEYSIQSPVTGENKKLLTKKVSPLRFKPSKKLTDQDARIVSLKNGGTILIKQLPGSPVASLKIGALGGIRYESSTHPGINDLMSRVWGCGTKTKSEMEMNTAIESLASSIHSFSGKNATGLSLTSLQPQLIPTFRLLGEMITEASFDKNIVARERKMMMDAMDLRKDKPSQQCLIGLQSLYFGQHPYGRDPLGNKEALLKYSSEDLAQHLKESFLSRDVFVTAVGDFNETALISEVEAVLAKMKRTSAAEKKFEDTTLKSNLHSFVQNDSSQSHLALVFPGIKITDQDRYALEVMQSILSGQGGRLFIELRDKESLAYSVSPIRMDGVEKGYFGAYIGCAPQKVDKARSMILAEFEKLKGELVPEDELARSKRFVIGRHDIGLQRTGNRTDSYFFDGLFGISLQETEKFSDRIMSVTKQEIQKVAAKMFSLPHAVCLVGQHDFSK